MHLYLSAKQMIDPPQEFTEQKGPGHPDTLSDGLAERVSVAYSKYTLDRYGAVLHHNFDKLGLLGGSSYVAFGRGYLTAPIRVLLNGRASVRFGDEVIPIKQLLMEWTKEYLGKQLPLID